MARKATTKSSAKGKSEKKSGTTVARRSSGGSRSQESMGEALIKLLQSPLVAELVAVAATAALASLAEHGFTSREGSRGKRAGMAVKEAGTAAAAAVGRRLGTEIDEIRKSAKAGAKA
jgi:hypothetical protein